MDENRNWKKEDTYKDRIQNKTESMHDSQGELSSSSEPINLADSRNRCREETTLQRLMTLQKICAAIRTYFWPRLS
jgi:hypothetical protein